MYNVSGIYTYLRTERLTLKEAINFLSECGEHTNQSDANQITYCFREQRRAWLVRKSIEGIMCEGVKWINLARDGILWQVPTTLSGC